MGTESARNYALAYDKHYKQHDLLGALGAYQHVIELHPTAPEADYSRSQMRNIVHRVVSARDLLDSQVELAKLKLQPVEAE